MRTSCSAARRRADSVITGGAADTTDVPERTAATNLALASLDSVAANVKRRFPGPVTVQQLKDAVAVEAQGASDVVTVSAQWDSPAKAAALANAFADEIVAMRRETAQADIQRAIDAATARVPAAPKTPAPDRAGGQPAGQDRRPRDLEGGHHGQRAHRGACHAA